MKVTFCPTKSGNGFKIAIEDIWLYASKDRLLGVVNGEARSCQFVTIDDSPECEFESPFEDYQSDEPEQY